MSKGKIALTVLVFVLITLVVPLVLLLALVPATSFSIYLVVFGIMFFGSIGFMVAMLFKVKSEIDEKIEELKVQNAAIAYRLSEMKKQGMGQSAAESATEKEPKKEKKERFDDFN